jgi:hypothetical protein
MNKQQSNAADVGIVILGVTAVIFLIAAIITWIAGTDAENRLRSAYALRSTLDYLPIKDNTLGILVVLEFIASVICFGFMSILATMRSQLAAAPPTAHIPVARVAEED